MSPKKVDDEKVEFLKKILENKDVLFGAFSAKLTAKDKERCWRRLRSELIANGSQLAGKKEWNKLRDETWQHCRGPAVKKMDNRRISGGPGPSEDDKWTVIDDLVLAILGRDSAVAKGLNVPEPGEAEQSPSAVFAGDDSEEESNIIKVNCFFIIKFKKFFFDCLCAMEFFMYT
jgi:hypothetical protein